MAFDERLAKVLELSQSLQRNRDHIVEAAVRDLHFTVKDSHREVDLSVARLAMFRDVYDSLRDRVPLRGPGSRIAVMLS